VFPKNYNFTKDGNKKETNHRKLHQGDPKENEKNL
jgi:hypothetical protein